MSWDGVGGDQREPGAAGRGYGPCHLFPLLPVSGVFLCRRSVSSNSLTSFTTRCGLTCPCIG